MLVLATTHTVNPGRLAEVKDLSARFTDLVEALDTGVLASAFFLSDDGAEVSNVQVHRDATAMDAYLAAAQPLIAEALELTSTQRVDVYGRPGPALTQVLRANAQQGAHVHVMPDHVSAFARAAAAGISSAGP
jgi:hypothetical protein